MGNTDSKFDDIILQNQRIEDWFISENQGRCELWINKKTGRRFQAYTIPQAVASDPQQLQKYAFRKHHDSYLVSVEGVLRQANGFLCSHAGSSFVLVENITSRLSDHQGALTFEQGLYVLSAAANGYNTLNSFFGPLQPTADMICINEVGHLKIWLNQNLAINDPSPNARGTSYNDNRQPLRSQDYALAKNRIKQCVSRLFEVVESATQGFPLRFKAQYKDISTYFQAANFIEYFSEQNGIRLPDHLFPIPNLQLTRESQVFLGSAMTSQVVNGYPVSHTPFSQEKQNLGTSRINYVYKSNFVNDTPQQRHEQSSNRPVRMITPPSNNQQPKIAFQVRPPLLYQPMPIITQQPMIGLPRVGSHLINVQQQVCYPPPNVGYTLNSVVSVPIMPLVESKTTNLGHLEFKKAQSKNEESVAVETGQMPTNFKMDIKRAVSIEQTIYQPKIHYKEENYLVQEPTEHIQEQHSELYSEQEDIQQTQLSFQNHLQLYEQQRNQQRSLQGQNLMNSVDRNERQGENWRSKYEHLLSGSNQKDRKQQPVEEVEDKTKTENSYSKSYNQHQIDKHNKYYRSPIPEQSQTFSPTPNHKNADIEEWENRLNKFSSTGKQAVQSSNQNQRKENIETVNQEPSKVQLQQRIVKQNSEVNMADLGPEELQRYIRAKYLSNTVTQPTLKQVKTYNQYKYSNYEKQADSWKGQNEQYSKLTHQPLQIDKISAPLAESHDDESNYPSFRPKANSQQFKGKHIKVQPITRQLDYSRPQVEVQPQVSRKPIDRKRVKVSDTTKIDQKYSKYVLNSQKPKAVMVENNVPIPDLNLNELSRKQRVNKKTNRSLEQGDKQSVTYGKLTSLLWEQ